MTRPVGADLRKSIVLPALLVVVACATGNDGESIELVPETSRSTSPETTTSVTTGPAGAADCPEVLAAELIEVGAEVFNVNTTVRSLDVDGASFADAWEVRTLDGEVLGVRVLTHAHTNEQPFTRSLSGVDVPVDITEVEVVARDSVRGFCGVGLVVAVPHS